MQTIRRSPFDIADYYGNDLTWSQSGYSALKGKALEDYRRIDGVFLAWAEQRGATEYQFPNLIGAKDLARINYLESFGHLATLPACIHPETGSSECLTEQILTPAACYHFYSALQNQSFQGAQFMTTRCNCFRREAEYQPLRRQWCFSMREIVCVGSAEDVSHFLTGFRLQLATHFASHEMPVTFEHATDPFFNPQTNPRYLMQRVDPTKHEMVFENDLAIGSLNNHRTTFGEAFNIKIAGEPAHSACVAFGVERWMYALASRKHNRE